MILRDWVSNLVDPSLSLALYKERKEEGLGVGRNFGRTLCKNLPSNTRKVDVGYYSGGGPNHLKTSRLFPFFGHFLPFHCRTTVKRCESRRWFKFHTNTTHLIFSHKFVATNKSKKFRVNCMTKKYIIS